MAFFTLRTKLGVPNRSGGSVPGVGPTKSSRREPGRLARLSDGVGGVGGRGRGAAAGGANSVRGVAPIGSRRGWPRGRTSRRTFRSAPPGFLTQFAFT